MGNRIALEPTPEQVAQIAAWRSGDAPRGIGFVAKAMGWPETTTHRLIRRLEAEGRLPVVDKRKAFLAGVAATVGRKRAPRRTVPALNLRVNGRKAAAKFHKAHGTRRLVKMLELPPVSKAEGDRLVAEFLARGGKVKTCPEGRAWGASLMDASRPGYLGGI